MLALNPNTLYDVLAINAASASTQIAGLPFSGPVAGIRVALIVDKDGQWVAFPTHSELERSVFDMVVAGRVVGEGADSDVAIMMVEAEATEHTIELIAGGATAPTEEVVAAGSGGRQAVPAGAVRGAGRAGGAGGQADRRVPQLFPPYQDDVYAAVSAAASEKLAAALQIAGKQERDEATDAVKAEVLAALGERVRRPRAPRSATPSARSPRSWSASGSSPTRSASTVAASPTSGRCPPRSATCRGCTARRCSSAARPRSWASPR